jgi:aldose 1-epimerase
MYVMRQRPITCESFGKVGGRPVFLFTLRNKRGMALKVTNFGATITELHAADRDGRFADVVLGFDTRDEYAIHRAYFGATVGRNANRIDRGRFVLGARVYRLDCNDPPHHLHGGARGWDKVVWDVESDATAPQASIVLRHRSHDGEQGYPGSVEASVRFTLSDDDVLGVSMAALCSELTLVNLARHDYWNLAGHAAGNVLQHELLLYADEFTPGAPVVPAGSVLPVVGTPFDFTSAKCIGRDIDRVGPVPAGYDHNFVVRGDPHRLRPVAQLRDPDSGRTLVLEANQPGVQLYTGNDLDGLIAGKGGATYGRRAGVCLETQCFPNAINVPAWRNQVVLVPGQAYEHEMLLRFSAS